MEKMNDSVQNFIKSMRLYEDEPTNIQKGHKRSRSNGEGSLRKKGSGWEGRYTAGFTKEGKQIRKSVYAETRKDCNEKLQAAIKRAQENNVSVDPDVCPTLSDWLSFWVNEYRQDLSASTKRRYFAFIKNISEETAKKKLTLILPLELQQYINTFISWDLARRAVSFLTLALQDAINNGYIQKNPAAGLRNPLSQPEDKFAEQDKALTKKEEQIFVDAIKDNPYRLIYLLGLYAGLRRGEATALTWDNIDLNKKEISVKEAAKRGEGNGYEVGRTKTRTSIRVVPICSELLQILNDVPDKKGYVCKTSKGKMINPDVLNMDFKKLMSELGQKHTPHHLRHTFSTRCHEKGIDIKVVQRWMGHSKSDMTMNTYTHATETLIADGLAKLG